MSLLWNANDHLTITTHDGSGQAMHPSVIDFLTEHGVASWAGYRYWMAFTPFPNAYDEHEDPNLVASHDGITWVIPNGLINPLDNLGGLNYNADTDMVYDPVDNVLRIYYRAFLDDGAGNLTLELRLVKVSANMYYTAPVVSILVAPWSQAADKIRSQCIWRESATKWHMWANGGSRPYKLWYLFSTDGLNWGVPQQCFDELGQEPFAAKGYENWHPACKPNYAENRIEFMTVDFINDNLIYSECPMDNPTLITLPLNDIVIGLGEPGKWDAGKLYRSSFTIETKDNDYFYRVWYTGVSESNVWKTGYTEGYLNRVNPDPNVTNVIPLGYLAMMGKHNQIEIPIYKESDFPTSPYKIYFKNQKGVLLLVDVTDVNASKFRVFHKNTVKAIANNVT